MIAANDIYRDTAYFGGVPGLEFDAIFLGLTGALHTTNPVVETGRATDPDPADTVQVEAEARRRPGLLPRRLRAQHRAQRRTSATTRPTGRRATRARSSRRSSRTAFRRSWSAAGTTSSSAASRSTSPALQNAWAKRPVSAPMRSKQKLTRLRYQLLMGPWYHVTAGDGIDMEAPAPAVVRPVAQGHRHRDHGRPTRCTCTSSARAASCTSRRYPSPEATPDDVLPRRAQRHTTRSTRQAEGRGGAAPIDRSCSPARRSPCDRQSDQWGAGRGGRARDSGQNPCADDDRTLQAGPAR